MKYLILIVVFLVGSVVASVVSADEPTQIDADFAEIGMELAEGSADNDRDLKNTCLVYMLAARMNADMAKMNATNEGLVAGNLDYTEGNNLLSAGNIIDGAADDHLTLAAQQKAIGDTAYGEENWGHAAYRYNLAAAEFGKASVDFLAAYDKFLAAAGKYEEAEEHYMND